MEPFVVLEGVAAPLDRSKVDTDQILPARFLRRPRKEGYGGFLFRDWMDDPQFVLNQAAWRQARILVADRNFGGGSSREQAPWALSDYGIRCVISTSFGDIFYNNCFKNGLLPVVLQESEVDRLFYECAALPGFRLSVDLQQQTVSTADRSQVMRFEVDAFRKYSLLNGLDEIGLTLRHADKIRAYEDRRRAQQPWLFR